MRNFFKNYYFSIFLMCFLFAVNPAESNAQLIGNTSLETNFKGDGTAFYTINGNTGQLSYLLDYGQSAGTWLKYGNKFREQGTSALHFKAIERGDSTGTTFYILDSKTGQLNFMSDYGMTAGGWASFGNPLEDIKLTEFEAQITATGMIFYVYDGMAKQMYFMQDFGEKVGAWLPFGTNKY